AGVVKELKIKVGDKVSQGVAVLTLEAGADGAAAGEPRPSPAAKEPPQPSPPPPTAPPAAAAPEQREAPSAYTVADSRTESGFASAHASPSVRRFARELGVDLGRVKGSGPKERVLKEDVQNYVKSELARPRRADSGGLGFNLPQLQPVDFAKFGPVQT